MCQVIEDLILSLGIHRNLLGFRYIRDALLLCFQDEDYLLHYGKLFAVVGVQYSTITDNVTHCIRNAVKRCCYNGNKALLETIAGYPIKNHPNNGEFIDILYCHLEKVLKESAH